MKLASSIRISIGRSFSAALLLTVFAFFISYESGGCRYEARLNNFKLYGNKKIQIIPAGGVKLNSQKLPFSFGITLESDAAVQLKLKMSGTGTDWANPGSESAVLSLFIDGAYNQDVVLWAGKEAITYGLSIGELRSGKHLIALQFAKHKSANGARGIELFDGLLSVDQPAKEIDRAVVRYAPILVGRYMLTNNHSDTPLALYYQILENTDKTVEISYGYVFSNEDGGDAANPGRQQARWGRLSDIQHVFTTIIDAQCNRVSERFEGKNHVIHPFNGQYEGTHPIIRTCTANNNVTDVIEASALRFHLLPEFELHASEALGELMRANPYWFSITAKELQREKKLLSEQEWKSLPELQWKNFLQGKKMPDPRKYIYVQYHAEHTKECAMAIQILLNNNKAYYSDFGVPNTALELAGWCQTAVLVPPKTQVSDIKEISLIARNRLASDRPKAVVAEFAHIYRLSDDYIPIDLKVPTP